jgi:tetratricopeptide (TPR) repeat protein
MDNADNRKIDYAEYFPSGHKGSIVITTRNQECLNHSTVGHRLLDRLEVEDAITLLLKASGVDEDLWPLQQNAAKEVVNLLGLHALAIIQAGAFVRKSLCSLEEYPHEFQLQRQRLLRFRPEQAQSVHGDVYATFEVSARILEESSDQKDIDALELLGMLAFLHFDSVPELLFTKAWDYAQEISKGSEEQSHQDISTLSRWHLSRFPGFMRQSALGKLDVISLRMAAGVLASFSLITVNQNHDMSMHPLAHAWANDRLKQPDQKAAWTSTVSTLALSTERYGSYQPFWRRLQPHVETCLDLRSNDCFNENYFETCQVFCSLGWFLHQMYRDSKAELLLTSVLENLGSKFTETSETLMVIKHLVARCFTNLGRYKRAAELLEEVVEIDKTTLAPEHPDRLKSQHELATVYIGNGQHQRGAKLLEEVVEIRKTTLAPEHPDRLASQHELARAYIGNGQHQRGAKLLEEVVEIEKTTLAPEHPNRLMSQQVLARAYIDNGQHQRAAELLEEVVEIQKKTLGPEHPNLLISQQVLASAYRGGLVSHSNDTRTRIVSAPALPQTISASTVSLRSSHRPRKRKPEHDLPPKPKRFNRGA